MELPNIYSPARCLLGDLEEEEISNSQKNLLRVLFCYAKKAVALKWKNLSPPSLQEWVVLVNRAVPMYKLTYIARECPNFFYKVWARWVERVSGEEAEA